MTKWLRQWRERQRIRDQQPITEEFIWFWMFLVPFATFVGAAWFFIHTVIR